MKEKILKTQHTVINGVPSIVWGEDSDKVYLYIHGKAGRKEEGKEFADIVCEKGYQVLAIDLPEHGERKEEKDCFDPWHVVPELKGIMKYVKVHWNSISLHATSIGAWFSMLSFEQGGFERCLLISPVLNMEHVINHMMSWAGVTIEQLEKEKRIPTDFGETLSWEYLQYVKQHPTNRWAAPTYILYGELDNLTDQNVAEEFAEENACELTIMKGGEHWFHTEEQMAFWAEWVRKSI